MVSLILDLGILSLQNLMAFYLRTCACSREASGHTLCYRLNDCVPLKFACWYLTHSGMLLQGGDEAMISPQ